MFEQINSFPQRLIFPLMFPSNHEITGITDALQKNAHDQNEQTIPYDQGVFHKVYSE